MTKRRQRLLVKLVPPALAVMLMTVMMYVGS
jgi:hypothetical protein